MSAGERQMLISLPVNIQLNLSGKPRVADLLHRFSRARISLNQISANAFSDP
jgi:hypothetical protein